MKNYLKHLKEKLYTLFMVLVYAFILGPIVVLVLFSFNADKFPSLPWKGFTLMWYEKLFTDAAITTPIINSLLVALGASLLSLAIGFIGAVFFNRMEGRYRDIILPLAFLPALFPPLLLGNAFTAYISFLPIKASLTTVIIFQAVYFSPIALALIYYKLHSLDETIELATYDLGKGTLSYYTKVLIPSLKWNLLGVFLLMYAMSWNEFTISWFVSGLSKTLPIEIQGMLRSGVSPKLNALGSVILLISIVLLFMSLWLLWGREE